MPNRLDASPRDRLRQLIGNRAWPRASAVRRLIAAALIMLAALLAVRPAASAREPTGTVVVAARDLAPGIGLSAADVRVVPVPAAYRPTAALGTADDVAGRVLAGPAAEGEPITRVRLVGPENTRLLTGTPGAVAVPVRLADPAVADLLTPGAHVDVVASDQHDAGRPALLAADAVVVTVRTDPGDRSAATRPGRLVVVAMPRESATRVAAVSLGQPLTVTLR